MEYENKYASKAVGGTALGIAIGAGALSLLNSNGLGGIFGNNCKNNSSSDAVVLASILAAGSNQNCTAPVYTRHDAEKDARIAELETEVKLRDANTYTDAKILELYKDTNTRMNVIEGQLCDQRVYNATNTAAIGCIREQVAQLMGLTKLVVPNGSICPGWGDVTVTITPTTTPA